MADEIASPAAAVETTTPKKTPKKGASKAKITRPKSSHPTTAIMVNGAIQNLKERGGSSLQAIKKYMSSNYKVDAEKLAPFIKKYIKAGVASGALVQTKGKGASGSFKLAATGPKAKAAKSPSSPKAKQVVAKKPAAKKPATKKTKTVKTPEKIAASTTASPKKPAPAKKRVAKPKKSPPKKPVVAAPKPKSPAKAKKTIKSPVKKPKSPKAKTSKPKAAAAKAKKASPKKK